MDKSAKNRKSVKTVEWLTLDIYRRYIKLMKNSNTRQRIKTIYTINRLNSYNSSGHD